MKGMRPVAIRNESEVTAGEAPQLQLDLRSVATQTATDIAPMPERSERPPIEIVVIRSKKRKKTAQARMIGSALEIRIPARLSRREERDMVDHFRSKFERRRQAGDLNLDQRTAELCSEYDLPSPTSVRWVSNQVHRWGSCTPDDGTIRLSDRLVEFPDWVIDYVVVHELAHLIEFGHNAAFWAIVERYPLTERARGFLMAKGGE
jgi:predicted metal-dependent hydrolase